MKLSLEGECITTTKHKKDKIKKYKKGARIISLAAGNVMPQFTSESAIICELQPFTSHFTRTTPRNESPDINMDGDSSSE